MPVLTMNRTVGCFEDLTKDNNLLVERAAGWRLRKRLPLVSDGAVLGDLPLPVFAAGLHPVDAIVLNHPRGDLRDNFVAEKRNEVIVQALFVIGHIEGAALPWVIISNSSTKRAATSLKVFPAFNSPARYFPMRPRYQSRATSFARAKLSSLVVVRLWRPATEHEHCQ
jgi:hypothetical protein